MMNTSDPMDERSTAHLPPPAPTAVPEPTPFASVPAAPPLPSAADAGTETDAGLTNGQASSYGQSASQYDQSVWSSGGAAQQSLSPTPAPPEFSVPRIDDPNSSGFSAPNDGDAEPSGFFVPKNDDVPEPGRRLIAPIMAGVLAFAALGLILWFFLGGRGSAGSDSPEAAVQKFADVVNGGDKLELLNVFAPSEIAPYSDVAQALQNKFGDSEVLQELWAQPAGEEVQGYLDEIGLSIRLEITDINTVEAADEAAIVGFGGYVYFDVAEALGGEDFESQIDDLGVVERTETGFRISFDTISDTIAESLDDPGSERTSRFDGFTMVTVKEDGGWYISPMMSSVNLVTEVLGEPAPNLDAVGDPIDNGAGSGQEAIEMWVQSTIDFDLLRSTQLMSRPFARLGQAFPESVDAISQIYQDLAGEEGNGIELVDLQLGDRGDGVYSVDRAELQVSDAGEVSTAVIEGDCASSSGEEPVCLLEYAPDDLKYDSFVIATDKVGDAYVVDPARSWSVLAIDWIENTDESWLLARLGLAQYDEPIKAEYNTDIEVAFGDKAYVVLEFDDADLYADVAIDRDDVRDSRVYLDHHLGFGYLLEDDQIDDETGRIEAGVPMQVVIFRDRGVCGEIFCSDDFTTDDEPFTVRVTPLAE